MDKESNAHYYAKHILRSWFKKTWERNSHENVLGHLSWEGGRALLEYPLYSKALADGSRDILGLSVAWKEGQYPTPEQVSSASLKCEAVIDVVLFNGDRPKYGFEIVHKHLCTEAKRTFLKSLKGQGYNFPVYEVSAAWILNQLHGRVPKILDMVLVN